MLKRDYEGQNCSITAALEIVGERWTLLIVRDAFLGLRRFEEFQARLGIARNVLTDRLNRLVEEGILEKVRYSERPERFEYRLTQKGRDLQVALTGLRQWGDKYVREKPPALLRRKADWKPVVAALVPKGVGAPPPPGRRARSRPGGRLELGREPGLSEVDSVAAHRNALAQQQLALLCALRQAAVGADDALPGQVVVRLREHEADEARRPGVDVAVGPDEALRDRADALDYALNAPAHDQRSGSPLRRPPVGCIEKLPRYWSPAPKSAASTRARTAITQAG